MNIPGTKRNIFLPSPSLLLACRKNAKFVEMKRYLLLITLALSLCPFCLAGNSGQDNIRRINQLVSEYSSHPDFNVVRLGRLGLAAVKVVIRHDLDEDSLALLNAIKDIKQITIADYEDCPADVRDRFASRLSKLLDKDMLLMEAKDSGEKMEIYGEPSERGDELTDLILNVPGSGALICIRGRLKMKDVAKIMD